MLTNQFWNNASAGRWQISSAAKWYPADVCALPNWEKWGFLESVFPGARLTSKIANARQPGSHNVHFWLTEMNRPWDLSKETNVGNKQLGSGASAYASLAGWWIGAAEGIHHILPQPRKPGIKSVSAARAVPPQTLSGRISGSPLYNISLL